MHGGPDRADHLARSVFTLHTRHWLEVRLGVIQVARKIMINADPVHLAAASHFELSHNGNVILCLAGDHASAAPDTRIQVNGHAPGIWRGFGVIRMLLGVVHREAPQVFFLLLLVELFQVLRIFIFIQSHRPRNPALLPLLNSGIEFHVVMHVNSSHLMGLTHQQLDIDAAQDARTFTHGEQVCVVAVSIAGAARPVAAIAEMQIDAIIRHSRNDPCHGFQPAAAHFKLNHVIAGDAKFLRGIKAEQSGIIPGKQSDGLG